jgi:hypothetical protein
LNESGKTPAVALPSGTLPENGPWLRIAPGLLDWLGLLGALLLYEDELDGAGAPGVGAWPSADRQRSRKPARRQGTARQAKDILWCRNCILGLRSFIDDKHKQPNHNFGLIQAAAV